MLQDIISSLYGGMPGRPLSGGNLGGGSAGGYGSGGGGGGGFSNEEEQEKWRRGGFSGGRRGAGGLGESGQLTSALGGKSSQSPHWQAWRRGTIPTASNFLISEPTDYYYSGGSPDPSRMMIYPDDPSMWDRSGIKNRGGQGLGGARSSNARLLDWQQRISNGGRRL